MGIFDSVWVKCPKCAAPIEFQSKGSENPYLRSYTPENAPTDVLIGAEGAEYCKCGQWVVLRVLVKPETEIIAIEPPENFTVNQNGRFAPPGFDVRKAVATEGI